MIDFYVDTLCDDISGFDSGYDVFNDYLRLHSDKSVIHFVLESGTDAVVAYFALITSALPFWKHDRLNGVPAIEIKMFALDKRYQGLGIASVLLNSIIETITYCATEYVGAKVALLYSVPVDYVMNLYADNGFTKIDNTFAVFRSDFNEGCVPMFKVL
ncbi:MAG: GNAT family N-acetyltransferase [Oscillospiraceae bacterium]|nr:GNAT family N-acetyltransferase [Oscillospiraceae bacterium]